MLALPRAAVFPPAESDSRDGRHDYEGPDHAPNDCVNRKLGVGVLRRVRSGITK